ncbi:hypothetical protein BP6252_05560 [Coleophoma cylindrospora]|uniref:Peptidase M61 catalytic domain-containing protein n=1 Tax=Coleophoma cylindrospora TaxID=1849047 RepID=A0A3D8RTU1_9HELO|nr:hypothetical protein BP6252_05560 [Coleophoma cylindrospora]
MYNAEYPKAWSKRLLFKIILLLSSFLIAIQTFVHLKPKFSNTLPATSPLSTGLARLDVVLTPVFHDGNATALNVDLRFDQPGLDAQRSFLSMVLTLASIDTAHIEPSGIIARDEEGPLELLFEDDDSTPQVLTRQIKTRRKIVGEVIVSYTALPRYVDHLTRNGPALDFRAEAGGLLGAGYGFLALPPDSQAMHNVRLSWDLSNSPKGTRAVWTFAEAGQHDIAKVMFPSTIQHTYFAVGPLKSLSPTADPTHNDFGVYWFGKPPFDAIDLASQLRVMFNQMSEFFQDKGDIYRIFLRHNPYRGSNTGTALERSFMFSYDDLDYKKPAPLENRLRVLSHEMVHNWVLLDSEAPITENWYSEGMAEYYSLLLRYRAGTLHRSSFVEEVNARLTSYYTNPLVNLSNLEASKLTWTFSDAQKLPYGRGFAYALKINGLLAKASNYKVSIDNLVLNLLGKSRTGERYGVKEYLEFCAQYIGEAAARKSYDEMSSGRLVIPGEGSLELALKVQLHRQDQEGWELGFDEVQSLTGQRVIQGLVSGSRAALSGLRNGDRLVYGINMNDAKARFDEVLSLDVERAGETLVFEYWPRSWDKVESYQFIDIEMDEL